MCTESANRMTRTYAIDADFQLFGLSIAVNI